MANAQTEKLLSRYSNLNACPTVPTVWRAIGAGPSSLSDLNERRGFWKDLRCLARYNDGVDSPCATNRVTWTIFVRSTERRGICFRLRLTSGCRRNIWLGSLSKWSTGWISAG